MQLYFEVLTNGNIFGPCWLTRSSALLVLSGVRGGLTGEPFFDYYYCEQNQVHGLYITTDELIKIFQRMIWLGLQLEQMMK